jgi:hypothetical protein
MVAVCHSIACCGYYIPSSNHCDYGYYVVGFFGNFSGALCTEAIQINDMLKFLLLDIGVTWQWLCFGIRYFSDMTYHQLL